MKRIVVIVILSLLLLSTIILYADLNRQPMRIRIDGKSLYISNNCFEDDGYTVVWECDAGTLSCINENSEYVAPRKSDYYLYAGLNEKVTWSPEDADGFNYSVATIRVHIYKYNNKNRYHKCDSIVYEDSLTVSIKTDNIVQINNRMFGNPIRDNYNDNWQQIIALDQHIGYVTLRYRFGKDLVSSERVCWETNAISLCDSTFQDAPIYVVGNNFNPDKDLSDTVTVCYDFRRFNNFYFDDTNPELYPAVIKIKAFILDSEEKRSSVTEVLIKYYYNSGAGEYTLCLP